MSLTLIACDSASPEIELSDLGVEADQDPVGAGVEAGVEAGSEAGSEAGGAEAEAGAEAGIEAGAEAGIEAGAEAGVEAGSEAGVEIGGAEALSWHQISWGWEHGCGVDSANQLTCWGRQDQAQLETPELDELTVVRVSTGRYHACVELTDGAEPDAQISIRCWGRGDEGQLTPPAELTGLHHVSAGWRATCALDAESHPHCWGELDPTRVPDPTLSLSELELGQGFGCGVTRDEGRLVCWGRDDYGQATPPTGSGYHALSIGSGRHACAINEEGRATCWGDSTSGKTRAPAALIQQISVGQDHACAVTQAGEARCWGIDYAQETDAPSGEFTWVSSGPRFTCGLRVGGSLTCWGGLKPEATPLFAEVAVGAAHTCAIKSDQSLNCWGWPRAGRSAPPEGTYQQVGVGIDHSCALSTTGEVRCWGVGIDPHRFERDGDYDQATPSASTLEGATAIAVGDAHTCAITSVGEIVCWGDSSAGQTDTTSLSLTTPEGGMRSWRAIALGARHSCALDAMGEVVCWGDMSAGQATPPSDVRFEQISAGGDLTCGVTLDGAAQCWGDLGERSVPEGLITQISVGHDSLCASLQGSTEVTCSIESLSSHHLPREFILSEMGGLRLSSGRGAACVIRNDERITCRGVHAPESRPTRHTP